MPTSNDEQARNDQAPEDAGLVREHHHATAEHLLRQYVLGGMAIGFIPIPVVDLAALLGLQLKMLHSLAGVYDIEFKADLGRSAIASLLGSAVPTSLSPTVAASLGKLIPGIGQTLSSGSAAILNGASTYAVGKVFIQHFAAGGTFLTFDPEAVRDFFLTQLREGKKASADLRKDKH
ncbi:MAG: DUF697 domain-containing protein [Thiohalocapsa sp.]